MFAKPQDEHQWLQQFVGEWTYELLPTDAPCPASEDWAEATAAAEAAATAGEGEGCSASSTGSHSVRSLGGLWIVGEGRGQMPDGSAAISLMTLGYSPETGKYVGTWVGSMMNHMWIYNGSINEEKTILALDTEGPSMTGEGMAHYQDVIEVLDADSWTLTGQCKGADGEWQVFMKSLYRRAA